MASISSTTCWFAASAIRRRSTSGEPDTELYLAGSRPYDFTDIDGTVITVNAENLTSHDPEGLHVWTDGQIRTAITKGVDDEHYAIYPIMPYPEYSLLTPEDVDSIIQYLRTVPPNDNVVASDFPRPDINPPACWSMARRSRTRR